MKTLKRDISNTRPQILWLYRRSWDRARTELAPETQDGNEFDPQMSAAGNKYKSNKPHLTPMFGGPCLQSQSTLFVLNKYNRISLFLYKWSVMHISPV